MNTTITCIVVVMTTVGQWKDISNNSSLIKYLLMTHIYLYHWWYRNVAFKTRVINACYPADFSKYGVVLLSLLFVGYTDLWQHELSYITSVISRKQSHAISASILNHNYIFQGIPINRDVLPTLSSVACVFGTGTCHRMKFHWHVLQKSTRIKHKQSQIV